MKRVNCNCDMPLGVYYDWLEDEGWCTDELRMDEYDVVGDANRTWYCDGYGDYQEYQRGDGNVYVLFATDGEGDGGNDWDGLRMLYECDNW